ncbi:MFS transporter [Pelomonas sp. CA6]|uniref:MFS transporter n=1 Tax=Pelomonas sp. CA6 TaxID=2907999 RepID=UPI001F4C4CA7|nr:MFS transporter [Pelomonas sp. CA6]MCH7344954.1 MFS transporter [Pelomonas sp. CA6]
MKALSRLRALGRPFWLLWTGQTISMVGTQMVQFAMSVWIYERTNSALSFAGAIVASLLPAVLVSPVAVSVVDRLKRRNVMIAADSIAALMTLMLLILLWRERLEVVHLYVFTAIASVVSAFQGPAFEASVASIVNKGLLTRAAGAFGVSATALGVVAPSVAGALIAVIGLPGIIAIDLLTFVSGTMFVWYAFSLAKSSSEKLKTGTLTEALRDSRKNFVSALGFFKRDTLMLALLLYSMMQAGLIAVSVSLVVPLILEKYDAQTLGMVLSFEALGALAGSMAMVWLDMPERRMRIVLVCDAIVAACVLMVGLVDGVPGLCAVEFLAGLSAAVASSCVFALWMTRVPESQRGGILVLTSTSTMLATASTVVFGGLLVERVLKPAFRTEHWIAEALGRMVSPGEGQAVAAMFVMCGLLGLSVSMAGIAMRPLRDMR